MNVTYDLSSTKLLLIDADTFSIDVLTNQFQQEGIGELLSSCTIGNAKELILSFKPDVLLLNVRMPDGTGIEFCEFLRQDGFDKPIIMLTGKENENDVISSLNVGANDYVIKPFRYSDLLTRVKSQLSKFNSSHVVCSNIGPLEFTPYNKKLSIPGKSKKILLTEKETLILKMLVSSFPTPVAKEVLLHEVWGIQSDLTTHTLETHIYRLRQKIKVLSEVSFIFTTEHGYGLVGGEF